MAVKLSFKHVTPEMWDRVWDILDRHGENEERSLEMDRLQSLEMDENLAEGYEPILTIQEAAEVCRVHRSVIDSLVKRDAIPYARFSERVVRFHRAELLQWIKRGGLKRE